MLVGEAAMVGSFDSLTIDIRFTSEDGSATHAPLIEALISGTTTLLVLDTGSDTHLLTAEFAHEVGLPTEPGEEGTDHAGTAVVSASAGTVPMRVGDATIGLESVVVIPAPPPFPPKGIGGIVSPQLFHPTAWIVLDMADDELVIEQADEAQLLARLADRHPGFQTLVLDRIEDGTIVVEAAFEPQPALPTLLNTGGRGTEVSRLVLPEGASGELERVGGGVSGADVMAQRLGPAVLAIGGARIPVPNLAAREAMEGVQAMVGMDVLRGTVLACTADPTGRAVWQLPPERLL
jgi:Aspartyl protease